MLKTIAIGFVLFSSLSAYAGGSTGTTGVGKSVLFKTDLGDFTGRTDASVNGRVYIHVDQSSFHILKNAEEVEIHTDLYVHTPLFYYSPLILEALNEEGEVQFSIVPTE